MTLETAWRSWQAGDLDAAERDCREAVAAAPGDPDAWLLCSRIVLQRGKRQEALQLLADGFRHTGEPALAGELAEWYLRIRDARSARPWILRIPVHDEPGRAWQAFQIARCDWLGGEHDEAIAGFARACRMAPGERHYPARLARALASLGRPADAAACLRNLSPDQLAPDMVALLALCTYDAEGPSDALDVVEWGHALHGAHPLLASQMAVLLTLAGDAGSIPAPVLEVIRGNERAAARWESFSYAFERDPRPVFYGLDTTVLARAVEAAPATGQVLEFGVYQALSLRFLAARIDAPIHGFDSFRGLPKDWKPGEAAGSYNAHGRLPDVPAHVTLHPGWFEDTLPSFFAENSGPVRLLHVDCDTYDSTATVLAHAAPRLVPGSIVVFDEYAGYPGWREHEFRAWQETVRQRSLRYEYLGINLLTKKAAVRVLE